MKKFTVLIIFTFYLLCHVQAMQIFVKTPTGTRIAIQCEPTDRIEDVKAQIATAEGLNAGQLILVFVNNILEDGNTLQDYSIQKDSTLYFYIQGTTTDNNENYYI